MTSRLHTPQLLGSFFAFLSSLGFAGTMLVSKSISKVLPHHALMLVRAVLGALTLIPFWYPFKPWNLFKTPHALSLLGRGIFQAIAVFLSYAGYRYLPGETAAFLGTSGPFFVLFLAHIFLGERLNYLHWITVTLGYAGVLLVLKPFALSLSSYELIPITANIFMALTIVLTRRLVVQKEEEKRLIFASAFFPCLFFGILGSFQSIDWALLWQNRENLLAVATLGSLSGVCHLYALRRISASFMAIFDYFRLVIFLLLNYLIYAEALQPRVWLGGAIIVGATLTSAILQQRNARS